MVTAVDKRAGHGLCAQFRAPTAGGFGKTTLARMVAHDPRVPSEFGGGGVWVTVGEDAVGLELAHKLVSAARLFDAAAPEVTDPIAAGGALGRALAGRRVLLVVDNVWSSGQVEPFLIGGEGAVRLLTTRQQGVFPDGAVPVAADQAEVSSSATSTDRPSSDRRHAGIAIRRKARCRIGEDP
jgi:hypothetical protein